MIEMEIDRLVLGTVDEREKLNYNNQVTFKASSFVSSSFLTPYCETMMTDKVSENVMQ